MDGDFIRNRITTLRLKKNISERELSFALGKAGNYINNITSGKALPLMENFLDICDYFDITPLEFFYDSIDNPNELKEIYEQIKRLSNNNLTDFLLLLKSMEPSDYISLISVLNRFYKNKTD